MNKEKLSESVRVVCKEFEGRGDDLFQIVGMIVVGQYFGWRVVRLIASRRHWALATRYFGDPKGYMDEFGVFSYKSVALGLINKGKDFWEVVRGRAGVPKDERVSLTL